MTAALLSVFLPAQWQMGWWLPLHLLLVGAASQIIVGGHIMFSATLGVSRGRDRSVLLVQLALLNVGAAGIIGGRFFEALFQALSFAVALAIWFASPRA